MLLILLSTLFSNATALDLTRHNHSVTLYNKPKNKMCMAKPVHFNYTQLALNLTPVTQPVVTPVSPKKSLRS